MTIQAVSVPIRSGVKSIQKVESITSKATLVPERVSQIFSILNFLN